MHRPPPSSTFSSKLGPIHLSSLMTGGRQWAVLEERHPICETTIALLKQAIAEVEVTSLIVKARRLVVAANSDVIPS